jgi:hypothetical protein
VVSHQPTAVSQKRPRATARREEQSLQKLLIQLCALYAPRLPELNRLWHIPNGGGRAATEAKILVGQGQRAGVPDLELPLARPESLNLVHPSRGYHRLYIEVKRPGEEPSEDQRDWIGWLRSEGNCVQVCQSVDAAWATILWYLRPRFPITRDFILDLLPHTSVVWRSRENEWDHVVDNSGEVWFETTSEREAVEFVRFCRGEW